MNRVYLDACIVIYYVQQHPRYVDGITRAMLPAKSPKPQLVVSDLTRLECRVFPMRRHDDRLLAEYDAFFTLPAVRHMLMDTAVFDLATRLRAQHNLKTPDALHLAAAIHAGCQEFWTNDDRLAQAAAGHITLVSFDETQ
ncbi:type II toxin-antitoxin system VapC family toxin [Tepidimonas charontis]|uniref:type II toxin-antitoxin system VapC family toxin n=1 Tax=Tepidimonas charontis TaxID=2267262 RepID=UPI0013761958|nr:PIN domain-containing protein [Tepidimonas charontis]